MLSWNEIYRTRCKLCKRGSVRNLGLDLERYILTGVHVRATVYSTCTIQVACVPSWNDRNSTISRTAPPNAFEYTTQVSKAHPAFFISTFLTRYSVFLPVGVGIFTFVHIHVPSVPPILRDEQTRLACRGLFHRPMCVLHKKNFAPRGHEGCPRQHTCKTSKTRNKSTTWLWHNKAMTPLPQPYLC